jgi:hypothetical protein
MEKLQEMNVKKSLSEKIKKLKYQNDDSLSRKHLNTNAFEAKNTEIRWSVDNAQLETYMKGPRRTGREC